MNIGSFDEKMWEVRLELVLNALADAQEPFLKAYWQANGRPTQITFNGQNETPYPSEDVARLYEATGFAKHDGDQEYFAPLRTALDHVRNVMRLHPSLTCISSTVFGEEGLQVGILNARSFTSLSRLIVGQMARRDACPDKRFRTSIIELNSLLQLSGGRQSHPLSNRLDIGYDIALFHGARILDTVELGKGYSLMPYSRLREHIDDEWLEDVAPEQFRHRNWDSICAVVHHFRWKPEIRPPNSHSDSLVRRMTPSFDGRVSAFANLLAVFTGMPHRWMMTIEGCVPRASSDLLGLIHNCGSTRKGRPIGHLFGPFRVPPIVDPALIKNARQHVFEIDVGAYAELAPVIQRLADALARDGRYAREDKVLDVAVSLERLFKPTGRRISLDLQNAVADTLGASGESKAQFRDQVKHFYDVRSAIIHGPVDAKKKQLLTETGEAFQNGFELARASLMKKLETELL